MPKIYSTYEAKAKFSEIMRQVREGHSVTVSYHGEPMAEIRPLEPVGNDVAGRLDHLEDRGALVRGDGTLPLSTAKRCHGALERFLQERNG